MRDARVLAAGFAAFLVCAGGAQAATPELSTTTRLQDRREVAAGPAVLRRGLRGRALLRQRLAHHRRDGRRVDAAAEAGRRRLVRARRPVGRPGDQVHQRLGLHPLRPPGHRRPAACSAPTSRPTATARRCSASADQSGGGEDRHCQGRRALRADGRLPVGLHRRDAQRQRQPPRPRRVHRQALAFTDDGALPGAPAHHYAALVAPTRTRPPATAAATGGSFRGPQPGHRCTGTDGDRAARAPATTARSARAPAASCATASPCRPRGSKTVWIAVAGSDQGLADAQQRARRRAAGPGGRSSRRKIASREQAGATRPQVSLPGDRLLQNAIDWGKQNLADLTQTALEPADPLDQPGQAVPGAARHRRPRAAGSARASRTIRGSSPPTASTPRSPRWRSASSRRSRTTCARCATSPTSSTTARASSCTRRSPTARSASATTRQTTNADGTKTNDFNTDETIKFPSAVALVWRWTGDNRFRDEHVRLRQAQPARRRPAPRRRPRRLARGLGQRRAHRAWARRSSTTASTTSARLLRPGRHGALQARRRHRRRGPRISPASCQRQFDSTWWDTQAQQYADSLLDPGNRSTTRSTGSAWCPWRPSSHDGDEVTPGVASIRPRRRLRSPARETPCFSGDRPGNQRPVPHRLRRRPDGKGDFEIFSLTTSIQAVGEGNYGRLGPGQQQRYTDANAETMFSEPATGNTPDEQPGAMPEIFPSTPQSTREGHPREHRPLLDVPLDVHAGVGQLRHRVAGGPPAARRAPVPGRQRAAGRPAGAAGPAERGGFEHPARRRLGRRVRVTLGQLYTTKLDAHGPPAATARDRPHAAAPASQRQSALDGQSRQALHGARPTAASR